MAKVSGPGLQRDLRGRTLCRLGCGLNLDVSSGYQRLMPGRLTYGGDAANNAAAGPGYVVLSTASGSTDMGTNLHRLPGDLSQSNRWGLNWRQ